MEKSNIKMNALLNEAFSVIYDLIKFSSKIGLQKQDPDSFYEQIIKNYNMGFISERGIPDINQIYDIRNLELKDNYILIDFSFSAMMADYEDVETFLCEKWKVTRYGVIEYNYYPHLSFLSENDLGIKIKITPVMAGGGYRLNFATVFTPEDLKRIIQPLHI